MILMILGIQIDSDEGETSESIYMDLGYIYISKPERGWTSRLFLRHNLQHIVTFPTPMHHLVHLTYCGLKKYL